MEMAEYIEREALIAFLEDNHDNKDWLVNQYNADWICSWIENQPAADVVAVVRCRDCRNSMLWRKPTDTVIGECLIRKMHSEDEVFCQVGADDFCSCGVRRSDNATW